MPNVAVLLEPFPIRNTFGAHAWVGERLVQMLLSERNGGFTVADMRLVCNEPSMAHIVGCLPAARPYLLQAPAGLQAPFMAAISDWHTSGRHTWRTIQGGSPEHEPLYEALIESLHKAYPFDVLAYWGTNETLRAVASRLGIPMMWAECGPLRAPFPTQFCLDASGVNGMAGGRDTLRLKAPSAPIAVPGSALDLQVGAVSAYEATMTLPPPAAAASLSKLLLFARTQARVVLLVMQLADDANILAFGNGWTCQALAEAMLRLHAGPGTVFIVRPHPGEANTYHTLQDGDAVRAMVAGRDDVLVFDDEGADAYMACLSVASEVVCINSSVGFEAAMLGKPIRVVGQASYMPPSHTPPGDGTGLAAPPVQLDDESIQTLLQDRFIPESRFWTLGCWREKAASVALPAVREQHEHSSQHGAPQVAAPCLVPRLPAVTARVFGKAQVIGDGTLVVEGLGAFALLPAGVAGYLDNVVQVSAGPDRKFHIQGWGFDPQSGGMLAGFVISAGDRSVWCSSLSHRPDVAGHYNDPAKLACGLDASIAFRDMPSAWTHPIRVFGVTATGLGTCLDRTLMFDEATSQFLALEQALAA